MKKTIPNDSATVVRIPYQLKKLIAHYAKSDNIKPSKFIRETIWTEIKRLEQLKDENIENTVLK